MANTYQQLGQARENSTNAVSVYSPGASEEVIIKQIIVANTSGAAATVRMFHDNDGTTYDESTTVGWDVTIPANSVWDRGVTICMNNAAGNFAYRSSVANALTITIYGVVKT
jgi:acetyltransferase-like isoleucine patch superfamily enzyme